MVQDVRCRDSRAESVDHRDSKQSAELLGERIEAKGHASQDDGLSARGDEFLRAGFEFLESSVMVGEQRVIGHLQGVDSRASMIETKALNTFRNLGYHGVFNGDDTKPPAYQL